MYCCYVLLEICSSYIFRVQSLCKPNAMSLFIAEVPPDFAVFQAAKLQIFFELTKRFCNFVAKLVEKALVVL